MKYEKELEDFAARLRAAHDAAATQSVIDRKRKQLLKSGKIIPDGNGGYVVSTPRRNNR